MAAIFEKNVKVSLVYCLDTQGVKNFEEIALSLTVKEIEAILCFASFGKNLTFGVKNFDEIALSPTVKKIEAFLCFRTLSKNSKIQNGRHFWNFFQKWV